MQNCQKAITQMAHEVEALLYAGETPWHKIGTAITPDQARDLEFVKSHPALNWSCAKEPMFLADGQIAKSMAVVRSTDRQIVGEVGADYTILQNAQAIDWFAPFIDSGQASIECVGSLREGSRIFVLARLAADPLCVVPGDEMCPYLLLANSHDGSLRLHVGFSAIRVVCANTLAQARTDGRSKLLQIRHTRGIHLALETVRQTIDLAKQQFAASIEQYQRLAATGCDDAMLRKFVNIVFRAPELPEAPTVHVAELCESETTRKSRVYGKIAERFAVGMGANISGVRGTLWGALNAVSEFVQYERGTDAARRLDETWFGTGAQLNQRAIEVALQLAA
jgi:phage/plasmid-like protein (TIGR03299 family)